MESNSFPNALERSRAVPFVSLAALFLEEYVGMIRLAVERLDEDQVWWRPVAGANSVGNLLLHLHGNLSLWILATLGGRSFERRRAEEFTADHTHDRDELLALLSATVAECHRALEDLGDAGLESEIEVQGYPTDVRGVVFHAVEHMSYHTGQILWAVKALTLADHPLELYPQHSEE